MPSLKLKSGWFLWLAAAGLAVLGGCAHYSLGSTGKLVFQSLYIAPVTSRGAIVPQAVEPLTNQLRETLLQEGVRLAGGHHARPRPVEEPAEDDVTTKKDAEKDLFAPAKFTPLQPV